MTHDRNAYRRARRLGAKAYLPEEYGRAGRAEYAFEDAPALFMTRLRRALITFEFVLETKYGRSDIARENLQTRWDIYVWMWRS